MNYKREKRNVKIPVLNKRPVFRLKKSEWERLSVVLMQTLTYRLFVIDCFVKKAQELAQNQNYQDSYSAYLNALSVFKKSDLMGTPVHFENLATKGAGKSPLPGKSNPEQEITFKEKRGNFRKSEKISYTYIENTGQDTHSKNPPKRVPIGQTLSQIPSPTEESPQVDTQWESYSGVEIKARISSILLELAQILWAMGELGKLKDVCREGLHFCPHQPKFFLLNAKLFKTLSRKKQTKKNLKSSLKNFRKYKRLIELKTQSESIAILRREISRVRRTFLKRVLRERLRAKLGLEPQARVDSPHVIFYLRRVFARVFHLIEKLHFSFTVSRKKSQIRRICRSFRVIRREFKDFLRFFGWKRLSDQIQSKPSSSALKTTPEDHRKVHLVLVFFMTIQKRWKPSRRKVKCKRKRLRVKQDPMLELTCKWLKFFSQIVPVPLEKDFLLDPEQVDKTSQEEFCGPFPEMMFGVEEVVQPAQQAADSDQRFGADGRGKQSQFNLSKELAKSADEIRQGIQQDFRHQNKVFLHLLKKLFKENCKTSSKNRQMKKQQKLEKNLSLLRERQELKILENVWETHSRYQQNCSNFNLSEILKVTETNSQKDQREDYILRAMNAFIMIFVCFFIFVSISVIYLIRINQF